MKKNLIRLCRVTAILLLITNSAFSQTRSKKNITAMKIISINVVGSKNDSIAAKVAYPLNIDLKGGDCSELIISVSGAGGTIQPKGPCKYLIRTTSLGVLKISVFRKTKEDEVKPLISKNLYIY